MNENGLIFDFLPLILNETSMVEWLVAFFIFHIVWFVPKGKLTEGLLGIVNENVVWDETETETETEKCYLFLKLMPLNFLRMICLLVIVFCMSLLSGFLLFLVTVFINYIFSIDNNFNGVVKVSIFLGISVSMLIIGKSNEFRKP